MTCPLASVIIPTYNKAAWLERTLASFETQTASDFEVVVVDDGSPDDTPAVIAHFQDRLPLRSHRQSNGGRSKARNQAIANARGKWLIFSDDDRIAAPGFVAEHVRLLQAASEPVMIYGQQRGILVTWHPDLPLLPALACELGARRHGRTALADTAGELFFGADDVRERLAEIVERFSFPERWWEESCMPHISRHDESFSGIEIPWLLGTTGNLSVARSDVIATGAFDETFQGWGIEDVDLCYRLHHSGVVARVGPGAISYHQAHPTGARRAAWLENLLHFVEKYDRIDAALVGSAFTRLGEVDVAALGRKIARLGALPKGPAVEALRRALTQLVEIRVRSLAWSGARHALGADQEDW